MLQTAHILNNPLLVGWAHAADSTHPERAERGGQGVHQRSDILGPPLPDHL